MRTSKTINRAHDRLLSDEQFEWWNPNFCDRVRCEPGYHHVAAFGRRTERRDQRRGRIDANESVIDTDPIG